MYCYNTIITLTVFVDKFMVGSIACSVSHIKEHQAKIVGFCSGMVSFIYVSFAPVARGGQADFKEKVLNEAQVSGRPVGEVAEEVCWILPRNHALMFQLLFR